MVSPLFLGQDADLRVAPADDAFSRLVEENERPLLVEDRKGRRQVGGKLARENQRQALLRCALHRKRTTGLEPATFGLGSRRSTS
jgi:hypothetical protein